MSEKVLGLKESKIQELVNRHNCLLHRKDFVSVRLASESVDLKWLEKWCKIIPSKDLTQYEIGYKQAIKDTLSWAEKEAKKKNE